MSPTEITSWVTSSYVTFTRAEMGHFTCKLSLFNCNKNTIRTKRAFIMKNPKTEEFLKSFKSTAIRAYIFENFIYINDHSNIFDLSTHHSPVLLYLDRLDTSIYQLNPSRIEFQHSIRNQLRPSSSQDLQSSMD